MRGFLAACLRIALLSTLGACLLFMGLGLWVYRSFRDDLPSNLSVLTDYRPLRASQLLSAEGEVIGEFFVEKRTLVPIERVPLTVRQAFVAAEDVRFYSHGGIDYLGILRAAVANVRAGQVVQGGSTITQQVAKLLIVGQERSLARKIREAMLAHRIEDRLNKDQILGIYLNHVYLGHGAYGIEAAAGAYFGKRVDDLSAAEAAMLAAMPKAPGRSTPFRDFNRAKARQAYVLGQMQELGFLTAAQKDAAYKEPLILVSTGKALRNVAAPYFTEAIRQYVAEQYGDEDLLARGLRIYTTLIMRKQRAAEAALRRGLEDLERKLSFKGPIGKLLPQDRTRMQAGSPRPFGPAGFNVDDDEQAGRLVVPANVRTAEIDATTPGAVLNPKVAQFVAGEAWAAARQAAAKNKTATLPPDFDPDTTYAAVITGLGRKVSLASGRLQATLNPEDETRALSWRGEQGQSLAVGDVLPVFFNIEEPPTPRPKKPAPVVIKARLSVAPSVQAALVALDPTNGQLLAMVGGYDYQQSQFNRARQARRQIGSAIKPFIYGAALESGLTQITIRYDVPVKFHTSSGVWAPHNYKPTFLGAVTLRTALAKSINTVAAQLTAQFGVGRLIELMRHAGVKSKLPQALSLALGSADLSLEELAYAMASFPAGGRRVSPLSILRITDAEGKTLEDNRGTKAGADEPQVVSPETAFVLTDMMRAVTEEGTARKAKALGRPVAGKTGTSNNYRDAWFVGFTPSLLCGVWVGRDDFKPIGHDMTGGHAALPIWIDFMTDALRDEPVQDFKIPPGIIFVRADADKGLPATPTNPRSRLVPIKRGTLPPNFRGPAAAGSFADPQF
ncbi:MAG: PBP1A family penicillin-binding protein [Deltaproteobacteria bacterium]|nr:PBP1A family penicillin-binding protein [Deltaproteobacteria bacterium]